MKAYVINIIGILFWVVIGHFFPSDCLFITPFYIPLLFLFVGLLFCKETNMYRYTAFCFIMLLLNDLLFRFFGGGTHDDVGRAICEIVFYTTFSTTTLSLLIVKLIMSNKKSKLEPSGKLTPKIILVDILYIFSVSIVSLLFFYLVNRVI
jgi:hypothetical protein